MEIVFQNNVNYSHKVILGNIESGGYAIYYENGVIGTQYYINSGYRSLTYGYNLGSLETVTSSYDQNEIKLYSNGVLNNKLSYPGAITSPANSTILAIGTNTTGTSAGATFFNGNIYSVRIYDRTLTDEEVYHNYMYDKEKFNLE